MGALLTKIVPLIVQLLAGIGVSGIMDKVAADKLPSYPKEGISPATDQDGKINIPKIAYLILAGVIGTFVFRFIAKKFRINF